jgi:hypothetical protein
MDTHGHCQPTIWTLVMAYLEERTLYPERSFLTGLPPFG